MGPLTRTEKKKTPFFVVKFYLEFFFHSLNYTQAEIIQTFKQEAEKKKTKNLKTKLKDTEEPETE